jgi:anti-anti-sigma factor
MEFTNKEYKRSVVVKGEGRIDSSTAPELEKALMEFVNFGKTLILDMQDIDFVSSAGWWAIIRVQKELKKLRNDLVLVNLDANVRDSMDLIGILPYFNIYDDMMSAVGDS